MHFSMVPTHPYFFALARPTVNRRAARANPAEAGKPNSVGLVEIARGFIPMQTGRRFAAALVSIRPSQQPLRTTRPAARNDGMLNIHMFRHLFGSREGRIQCERHGRFHFTADGAFDLLEDACIRQAVLDQPT